MYTLGTVSQYIEYKYYRSTQFHPEIAHKLMEIVATRAQGGVICELGSGSGWLCNRLAQSGHTVVGVERSNSGIEVARSSSVSGAKFVLDSIDPDLPGRLGLVGQCSVVLSSEVIEHLYRPADLVLAARDLLQTNGVFVVSTPYHGYIKNLAIALLNRSDSHFNPLWDGGHIKFFSKRTLSRLLSDNGLSVEDFQYMGRVRYLWKSMICISELSGKTLNT